MGQSDSRAEDASRHQHRLLQAVLNANTDEVIDALKQGANVNAGLVIFQGTWKRLNKRLLHVAAELGHIEVAKILIQHGAIVNSTTVGTSGLIDPVSRSSDDEIRDLTPLHIAAAKGNDAMVKLLLKYSANVNAATLWNIDASGRVKSASSPDSWKRGWTALHIAALKGFLEIVHLLLRSDIFVNASVEASGWTALHYAAYQGHVEIVRLLLHHGANASMATKSGKIPIELTANPEIHALLSKYSKRTDSERLSPNGSLQGKLLRLSHALEGREPRLADSKYIRSLYEPMLATLQRHARENNYFGLFGIRWKAGSADPAPSKSDIIKRKRQIEDSSYKKQMLSSSPSWFSQKPSLKSINNDTADLEAEHDPEEERLRLMGLIWDNIFKYDDLYQCYVRLEKIRCEMYPNLFGQSMASLEAFQSRLDEIDDLLRRYSHIDFLKSTLGKEVELARNLLVRCIKSCE